MNGTGEAPTKSCPNIHHREEGKAWSCVVFIPEAYISLSKGLIPWSRRRSVFLDSGDTDGLKTNAVACALRELQANRATRRNSNSQANLLVGPCFTVGCMALVIMELWKCLPSFPSPDTLLVNLISVRRHDLQVDCEKSQNRIGCCVIAVSFTVLRCHTWYR